MAGNMHQVVVLLLVTSICYSSHACFRQNQDERTPVVTDKEIQKVSEKLYKLDKNGARPGKGYVLNTKGPKLFTFVNASVLRRPTYAKLKAVQSLYTPEVGIPEKKCPPCAPQENAFLDAVMNTSVMNETHKFLKSKGLAGATRRQFRSQLAQWWMLKYSRSEGKANDSCGFEHVFAVDLMEDGSVGGLHNWVYYYYGERNNKAKYLQFIQSCKPDVLTFKFSYLNKLKPVGGFYIGPSPELQMALGTLCFRVRPKEGEKCLISLGGAILDMHTFAMPHVKPTTLSSTYPICLT